MTNVVQKREFPFFAFDIDFLQPMETSPHTYKVFSYQKPITKFNGTTKEFFETTQTEYLWFNHEDYSKALEGVFNTKEEYLYWKNEWRAAYKELSKMIRHAKNNRKINRKDKSYSQHEWQIRAAYGKFTARKMMMLLNAAKDKAWQLKIKNQFNETEIVAL